MSIRYHPLGHPKLAEVIFQSEATSLNNKIRSGKSISFSKSEFFLLSFPVIALTISFRVWPGTFAEVMSQRFMPSYDTVTTRDSGTWPLPAPEWLPTPVIKRPARPEFNARPDRRNGIKWWKEFYWELERELTGKNAEKGPGNKAKSSKLWTEREKLNHLNDPESSDLGLMGYFGEDDEGNNYDSANDRASETALQAINPSPSIDTRSGTPNQSFDTLTTSSVVPRQVSTGTNDYSERKTNTENPGASTSTVSESSSLPAVSASGTSSLPKQTPLSNLAVIKEELGRESEQCLKEYSNSYCCRAIKKARKDILSSHGDFDVEPEPYLEEARQNPKTFSDEIRKRREKYGVDSFPFPETKPVVENMAAGICFFLQTADSNESIVYNDFLTLLDEVKANDYRYREVILACWIFTILADFYYDARGEYERAAASTLDKSPAIYTMKYNPEILPRLYPVLKAVTNHKPEVENELASFLNIFGGSILARDYSSFSKHLTNIEVLYLPGFSPLDIDFFDKTVPYLMMAASLLNQPLIEADAALMTPYRFFIHDVRQHTGDILCTYNKFISGFEARNQPYESYRDALVNFLAKARQKLPASVSVATTLVLFNIQHETSQVCLWALPDLPLYNYFDTALQIQNQREFMCRQSCKWVGGSSIMLENPGISDIDYLYATLFLWITIEQTRQYRQQPETIDSLSDELITEILHKWENAVNLTRLARKISRAFIDYIKGVGHSEFKQWEELHLSKQDCEHLFFIDLHTDSEYLTYFLIIALDPDQASWFFQALRDWLNNHPEQLSHLIEAVSSDDLQWLKPESFH